ncbi:MAG TPA: hypothetical protein VGK59_10825 [Ohtaekwangia sp.]
MVYPVSHTKTKEAPPRVKPEVGTEVLTSIDPAVLDDSYVYVHCHFQNEGLEMLIRIWRTTFLVDRGSGSRSQLVHAENISYAPLWTMIPATNPYSFLLIFPALPKGCTHFDMVEEIPQPGGFFVRNIKRNQQDVYHINV